MGLFSLRNRVLGIRPTSKRPVIPYRYDLNREFLGLIADEAARNDVRLILYVIPLNPLSENPYVPGEYAAFKTWLEAFARERRIAFADLERAVPEEHWGEFMGGPDFKHFRGEGHRITAAAILARFRPLLLGDDDVASAP